MMTIIMPTTRTVLTCAARGVRISVGLGGIIVSKITDVIVTVAEVV